MKIQFTSIVIIRKKNELQRVKIEIPRSVWQENGLQLGDMVAVSLVGRVFEAKISGDENQKLFRVPIDLARELRLRDSESVEVEIEKVRVL